MTNTIDHRPFGAGPDDPTGRLAPVRPAAPHVRPAGHHGRAPGPFPPIHPGYPPHAAYPVNPGGRQWGWVVVAACGVVLLIALLGAAVSANSAMTVPGTLTLHMNNYLPAGSPCEGANYASWLDSGTPVTIYDAGGSVVGTTSLGGGTATATGSEWSSSYAETCVFSFTLTDVPAGDDFYRVAAGSSSGGVTFTAAELRENGANLSIGD